MSKETKDTFDKEAMQDTYSKIDVTTDECINKMIDEMNLFDDDLMSRVFDRNIEATEHVLRVILGRNIRVISARGQVNFKNPVTNGRNITLDVHAVEENGQEIDIEVQSGAEGAHIRRARFHSSMTDARMLKKNQKFRDLKDSYVIFIYKHDKFGKQLPIYHINRHVEETGELFGDGSHIIYVNGTYRGNDEVGQLMRDFHQREAGKIENEVLAKSVKHFKETKGGRELMCEAVEKYAEERAKKAEERGISRGETLNLIKLTIKKIQKNYTIEEVADDLEESVDALRPIYETVKKAAPDYDAEKIFESLSR